MLRFLFIVFLFFVIIYYVLILPFNRMHQQKNNLHNNRQDRKKARNSNLDIDYIPENKNHASTQNYKGGDYVDYEEVKDK